MSDMDADVARALGWEPWIAPTQPRGATEPEYWQTGRRAYPSFRMSGWNPSTNVAHAFLAVEHFRDRFTHWNIADIGGEWHVRLKRVDANDRKVFYGEAADASLPRAICRAILSAVQP